MNNKLNILIDDHGFLFEKCIRLEGLILSLEKMPQDMIIKRNELVTGPMGKPALQNKTVAIRLEEVRIEYAIFKQRLETTKEMIEGTEGGKEAISKWVWIKPKNE